MHRNTELIFCKHALPLLRPGLAMLEVGAGKKFWKSFLYRLAITHHWKYHFCDVQNHSAMQPGFVNQPDEYEIAAADDCYNLVVASQVLEHVREPWLWVCELARVLRANGHLVLIAPLTWVPHSHPRWNPYDCWRVLPDGMRSLLEWAELEVRVCLSESLDDDCRDQFGNARVTDTIGVGWKP